MARRDSPVNLSYDQLEALRDEQASELHELRLQLRQLEQERDQARHAIDLLTEALRRRGCCDHEKNGGAF